MGAFIHYPCVWQAAKYHHLLLQVFSQKLVPWGVILQTHLFLIQSPLWSAGVFTFSSIGFETGLREQSTVGSIQSRVWLFVR